MGPLRVVSLGRWGWVRNLSRESELTGTGIPDRKLRCQTASLPAGAPLTLKRKYLYTKIGTRTAKSKPIIYVGILTEQKLLGAFFWSRMY